MKPALNSYSLRNEWNFIDRDKIEAIAGLCKDMVIDQVELLDRHFDKDALPAACKALADHGITVFAIGPHVHLLAKPSEVQGMIDDGKEWLGISAGAGVKMVRFQVGDGPLPRAFAPMDDFEADDWKEYNDSIAQAIEHSRKIVDPLLDEAERLDVDICIETHHSYSSNWVYMKQFEQIYQSKNIGWIFDIGNYENDAMRWKALDIIKSNVKYIHAKAYTFDEQGLEPNLDFPKIATILAGAGFDGNWSIEFEGKMNGILGAFRSNELVKHAIAVATGGSYTMKTEFGDEDDLMERYCA